MPANDLVKYLSWDSDFFGRRIGRILADVLDSTKLREIFEWQRAEKVACLYFLADPNQAETLKLVEQNNFHLTDLRVTLERAVPVPAPTMPVEVRLFAERDRAVLRAIARISHRDSRFYFDGHFPRERCDQLYDTWISKSCDGYADVTMVAEVAGQTAGYITCHKEDQEGTIGLVGVHPDFQGRALGQALVNASLAWFAREGFQKASVVTQGRNNRAQRLYQRCGFLSRSIQLWYHWWDESIDKDNQHE
jgi:dTDP-4-amino-4,6-dideoxy-D-galactose acyltransferase